MLKIFQRIHMAMLYPFAFTVVFLQSTRAWYKALGKKPKIHFEAEYAGQRIMLLALYEKGVLRPDVIRLLQAARAAGLYVLAVNTLKLRDPESLRGLADCYIERPNFGRDFGSYKTGFLHLAKRGWDKTCPRLLMLNDSIYFSEDRLPKFIDDMMGSDVEVLGSTENYEIEYHLGSFCIAMAGSVLRQDLFRKYWRQYRLTDVRPLVILRGEMRLSRTLKRCVSAPSEFSALYGTSRFLTALRNDPSLADFTIRNRRTSDLTGWKRLSPEFIYKFVQDRFFMPVYGTRDLEVSIESQLEELNQNVYVNGVEDLRNLLERHLVEGSTMETEKLHSLTVALLTEIFMDGSQIHQNPTVMLKLGLPIVKLDGLYRGMFNIFDIENIVRQMTPAEREELQRLLLERPYGGTTLIGWKRAAFMRGLI